MEHYKTDAEVLNEFDRLGGEELLSNYDAELPEGNLTSECGFPESPWELDPEKVKAFITQTRKNDLTSVLELVEVMKKWTRDVDSTIYNSALTDLAARLTN